MLLKPSQINKFTMLKLPSVFFTGVRVREISKEHCVVTAKLQWITQNPFKSMFWAIQGMAAELATGALVMSYIRANKTNVSMLVVNNKANFSKKAKGRITFTCNDGLAIEKAIEATIENGEGQTCWMTAKGVDAAGDVVSTFEFEWTVRRK